MSEYEPTEEDFETCMRVLDWTGDRMRSISHLNALHATKRIVLRCRLAWQVHKRSLRQ